MPKLDKPLYGDSATGEITGTLAFKKDRTWNRLEKKRVAAASRSSGQAAVRDLYKTSKNQWLALSDAEKLVYSNGAPQGWTGFNYFLFIALRAADLWLGGLVFYQDLINQGNVSGVIQSADYQNNFPGSADVLPTLTDGEDNFQAWLFNKLKLSLTVIEGYLIAHKASIEGA